MGYSRIKQRLTTLKYNTKHTLHNVRKAAAEGKF